MEIVDRPGYFGHNRKKKEDEYDQKYGVGNWLEGWEIIFENMMYPRIYSFEEAIIWYDLSYYNFLAQNKYLMDIVCEYGECYDNDPSNVQCGLVHDPKSYPRHLQDVSVRRAMKRLGVSFNGPKDMLLQIRGLETNGYFLNPGRVPFCDKGVINKETSPARPWVNEGTVEEFWQRNKVIVVGK